MLSENIIINVLAATAVLLIASPCTSFQASSRVPVTSTKFLAMTFSSSEQQQLKSDLVTLASSTRRGFAASKKDRDRAKTIINRLSQLSPTETPAAAYYTSSIDVKPTDDAAAPSLAGKWTLIYTDAPDITSLDAPLSIQKLGRIGQECTPPLIKNVIEWKRPDWASALPLSGNGDSVILQKVVTEGSSTPSNKSTVNLKIVGLEVTGAKNDQSSIESNQGVTNAIYNGPASFFEDNPIKLQGPLKGPFGKFDIMYLDEDMRITKTNQGYFAVNVRQDEENQWF